MIKIASILAATGLVAALGAAPAEAHFHGGGFHGGFHGGYHGGHHFGHGHWGHRWGGHRWGWGYGHRYHYGHRSYGYRSYGYSVAAVPRVCPPGSHLGYMGRYCHPNY